ncbi:hypothetical protein L596_025251 [Steinernema carpocapsae]|uniref:Uncharacterized protein n=1 Tax=Steinernema carpocapsae TaxID=34508 RepID=A0A4U5M793_STECR|nr:hypothetical protein L596_025251 [Steinernema carpocapsae]
MSRKEAIFNANQLTSDDFNVPVNSRMILTLFITVFSTMEMRWIFAIRRKGKSVKGDFKQTRLECIERFHRLVENAPSTPQKVSKSSSQSCPNVELL